MYCFKPAGTFIDLSNETVEHVYKNEQRHIKEKFKK